MNKKEILERVIVELEHLLMQAITAATNAHNAAIDDQSVAETQYDTLAIEAAYLAEGQSRRVDELKEQITELKSVKLCSNQIAKLGALIKLEYDSGEEKLFFVLPCAAGTHISYKKDEIFVITPKAPLTQNLLGKTVDDEFLLENTTPKQSGIITDIL